jgi:membrane-bound metal-dependent hydrolase YbcI (DUF457 family)
VKLIIPFIIEALYEDFALLLGRMADLVIHCYSDYFMIKLLLQLIYDYIGNNYHIRRCSNDDFKMVIYQVINRECKEFTRIDIFPKIKLD